MPAGAVLLGAIATGVSLVRQPGYGALDTVWAEDGSVFLADAVTRPLPEALLTSYAGYFHTAPRLLAVPAALAGPDAAAAVIAVTAAAVTAALAVLVYVAAAAHLPDPVARVVAASLVVVPPLAQGDVPNSLANLHWPALYALFWVLLWTPTRVGGRVVAVLTVALVTTSDILVVALLPLALLRLMVRRDRHTWALSGAFGLGVAVQALGLLTGASDRSTDLDPVAAVVGYALRVVPGALLGSRWTGDDPGAVPGLVLAAWTILLAAVVMAVLRGHRPGRGFALVAVAASGALYALPVLLSGVATPRYALAPALLLVCALLAVLPPRQPGAAGWAGNVLVVLLVIVCAANLRVPNPRADGPSWQEELAKARAVCQEAGVERVELRVAPLTDRWYAQLPCSYLTR